MIVLGTILTYTGAVVGGGIIASMLMGNKSTALFYAFSTCLVLIVLGTLLGAK